MTAKGVREKVDQAYGIGMDMEIFQTKKALERDAKTSQKWGPKHLGGAPPEFPFLMPH